MLVSLAVVLVIGAAAMTLALSSREVYEQDRQRTTINQNLRCGMDLLGIDVRQAGERMPGDAPAIEIQDGASGGPDTLILRRNLLDYVLPLCRDINAGSSADSIFVAKKKISGPVPPGCAPVPDSDHDGWPDNLGAWRNYRISHGGSVLAYIHNPVTGQGEFFIYDAEDKSDFHVHKANPGSWEHDYTMSQEPRIYIIEQRKYVLQDDVLQCILNEDTSHPLNLVNHINDFQARALLRDGTVLNAMPATTDWTQLHAVEIELVGGSAYLRRTMRRTLVGRFFPRNVLSNE